MMSAAATPILANGAWGLTYLTQTDLGNGIYSGNCLAYQPPNFVPTPSPGKACVMIVNYNANGGGTQSPTFIVDTIGLSPTSTILYGYNGATLSPSWATATSPTGLATSLQGAGDPIGSKLVWTGLAAAGGYGSTPCNTAPTGNPALAWDNGASGTTLVGNTGTTTAFLNDGAANCNSASFGIMCACAGYIA